MQHMSSETPAQGVQQLARHLSHDGGWTDPVDDPRSIGSKFGEEPRRTLETVGASLTIDDPSQIPVANGSRTWSVGFSLANAIWALRGSRSASDILPYNPKGSAFVEGGNFDAALGSRIASAYSDPIALRSIVNLLRSHPQSDYPAARPSGTAPGLPLRCWQPLSRSRRSPPCRDPDAITISCRPSRL